MFYCSVVMFYCPVVMFYCPVVGKWGGGHTKPKIAAQNESWSNKNFIVGLGGWVICEVMVGWDGSW